MQLDLGNCLERFAELNTPCGLNYNGFCQANGQIIYLNRASYNLHEQAIAMLTYVTPKSVLILVLTLFARSDLIADNGLCAGDDCNFAAECDQSSGCVDVASVQT
jgi:hypothetical protein